ncbi:MAG: phosphate ABC transporter ATP-binding protein [Candidatus Omnitrophica bacterium]|nr:phosphate ABC transporter ATP-binding protein [Candidatus Omnitrophota bacterium]
MHEFDRNNYTRETKEEKKVVKFDIQNLSIWFKEAQALKDVTMQVEAHEILSVIGPSNSGKTTFLRTLNRLNDLELSLRMQGFVYFEGKDIRTMDVELVRKKMGMVFALPLPLPLSIFDNVAYGVRMHGEHNKKKIIQAVQEALQQAYIWDEVKDRLSESAFKLSGGQQQRLCIARTLAVGPEVILFDEPCSGLDPISTAKVEETMLKLKEQYTIVLVTNNVKQAARVGDRTAFFLMGELIELEKTDKIFTSPAQARTNDYISGKFG